MQQDRESRSRRSALKTLSGGAVALGAALATQTAEAQTTPSSGPPVLMDGHVHITNRVFWEKIDPGSRRPLAGITRVPAPPASTW